MIMKRIMLLGLARMTSEGLFPRGKLELRWTKIRISFNNRFPSFKII